MSDTRTYELRRLAGLFCALLAAFIVPLGAIFYKLTTDTASIQVWFLRSVVMYLISIPYLTVKAAKNELPGMDYRTMGHLFSFGLLAALASICFFISLDMLTAGECLAIYNSSFIFVLPLSYVFLKERHHPITVLLALLSVVGVVLVARPSFIFGEDETTISDSGKNRDVGLILAVLCACLIGFRFISGRKLNNRVNVYQMTASMSLQSVIAFPIYAIAANDGWYIPCQSDWWILLASATCHVLAGFLLSLALLLEQAGPISMVYTLLVVFAFLLEILVLQTIPAFTSVLGAALIVFGAIGTFVVQIKYPT